MNHTRVVNSRNNEYDIYIGRPTKWGNPFTHLKSELYQYKVNSRLEAIQNYAYWVQENKELLNDLHELKNKTLGCFCVPDLCHGTVLAELVDRLEDDFKYSEKEFTEHGDDLIQAIYKFTFGLKKHIEIEGNEVFIDAVEGIIAHINKTRKRHLIILRKEYTVQNIIKTRIN